MAKRAKTIDLLRVVDLLQEHITPTLCRAVFGAVRRTELEGRDPTFPRIEASPEALAQRIRIARAAAGAVRFEL